MRRLLFWLHFAAGLIAGLVILVMSFTGAALAFEKQVLAWAERDLARVEQPSPTSQRLPVDVLVNRLKEHSPDARLSAITVFSDPHQSVLLSSGRDQTFYANPYTGEITAQGSQGLRRFFHTMENWHRWLGMEGEKRPWGKAITGACNAAFVVLTVTGLILWWPRSWRLPALRQILWPKRGVTGKARDWNWHNAFGFWSAPVLLVLTVTGMVISYRWASDLVFKLVGEEPPVQQGPAIAGAQGASRGTNPRREAGQARLGAPAYDKLFAAGAMASPGWESLSLRLAGGRGPQGPAAREGSQQEGGRRELQLAVRQTGAFPPFATTQLSLDANSGEILRTQAFTDHSPGRRLRSWMRFLHTGEALALPGQILAFLACLSALLLVYTGAALALRRMTRH